MYHNKLRDPNFKTQNFYADNTQLGQQDSSLSYSIVKVLVQSKKNTKSK